MKAIRFATYQDTGRSDAELFIKMIVDVEQLSRPAHDEDQTNHPLCACVWSAAEGQEWALHAQAKDGIDNNFATAVEEFTHALHKYEMHIQHGDS